jgi:transcriptional antiterminator RfaH
MVLHTKARQEKAVARYLNAAGEVFYLPLITRVTLVRGRKLRSRVPLLPGYVFLSGDLDAGYAAVSTKRVCRIIPVADQAGLLDELVQIDDALARGAELYSCPFAVVGTRCRVRRGPFEGIEGEVTSKLGSNRLALQIRTIGQGAILEIDADLLEPLE